MFRKGNWARFGKAAVGLGIIAVATAFDIYHVPYVPAPAQR